MNNAFVKPVKIGLYLQGKTEDCKNGSFEKAMAVVKDSDIDILVLPEFAHVPFEEDFHNADLLDENQLNAMYEKSLAFSRDIGRAVVICNNDKNGMIMCIWANAFATDGETKCKNYIKHTMTGYSACQLKDYPSYAEQAFKPIIYKGVRIGMTACYDCNHAMFSRKFGLNGVDIIVNSTGGDVEKDKWYKYNKACSIENSCFTFVTMGHLWKTKRNYVFGFSPNGKELKPVLLNGQDRGNNDFPDGVYVYDTAVNAGAFLADPTARQKENPSKDEDLFVSADGIIDFYMKGRKIKENLRVLSCNGINLVMCLVKENEILKPESVMKLLYARELADLGKKKYLIINHWAKVDEDFYDKQLSLILKVHAMQNFCAVLLTSSNMTKCIQVSKSKTVQVVKSVDGRFGLALQRMGGPEVVWKNKEYGVKGTLRTFMKKAWRENVEWLIESM